jgi:hypothetical protein
VTTGTIDTGTFGTTTSTAATITTGTIPTLTSITKITSGTGTAAAPAISPTGDTNTGVFFPAADTIAFSEGGAEAMRIDSDGNVGIGITSPTEKLHVIGNTLLSDSDAGVLKVNRASASANQIAINSNGTLAGYIGATSTAIFSSADASGVERLRIDSDGNVGIGTTSPAVKLDVSGGNIQGKEILLQNGAASSPGLGTTPSWYSPASGVAALSTNAAERLRINASGSLLIGATSDTSGGAVKLRISDGTIDSAYGYKTGGVEYAGTLTNHPFSILTNNAERLRIDSDGDVSIGTATALSKLHVHGNITLSNTTTATSAGTGGLTLPASAVGYLTVSINGTSRKIPYYAT